MAGFRYKRGMKVPAEKREKLWRLCVDVAGVHDEALWDFVTTTKPWQMICMDRCVSQATLFRCVRKFYERMKEK